MTDNLSLRSRDCGNSASSYESISNSQNLQKMTCMGTPVNPSPTIGSVNCNINQSVSSNEDDSVFASCHPISHLQHIQSQTPRTPRSCYGKIDINNNTNLAIKKDIGTGQLTMERARAHSATEFFTHPMHLSLASTMAYKPFDIVSPSIRAMQLSSENSLPILSLNTNENSNGKDNISRSVGNSLNNSIDSNVILHKMNDSNSPDTSNNAPKKRAYHHHSESTPIHELTKSALNISDCEEPADSTASMNNIDLLCALLEDEEKDAMDAIYAECDSADESRDSISTLYAQSERDFLLEHGYEKIETLTKTLQGCVFKARNLNLMPNVNLTIDEKDIRFKTHNKLHVVVEDANNERSLATVVIKRTNKELHSHGITIQDGKQYSVDEDILKEMKMMKYFQSLTPPSALIRYLDFFESSTNYYLVMEDGGIDCFDFAVQAHAHIADGRMKIKEWRKFCKFLFWQMTLLVKWLHTVVKCCHLDISLENLLLQEAEFIPKPGSKKELTLSPHIQIKFCDFGLAEFFDVNNVGDFRCTKYCGKVNYKAPQVYHKKGIFDARKADIWSLGIVFFSMVIGAPPYIKPVCGRVDDTYDYVERGCISQLLYDWERNDFVTLRMLNLMNGMLKVNEHERLSITQIFNHTWLRLYKEQYSNHHQLLDIQQYSIRERSKSSALEFGGKQNQTKNDIPVYRLKFSN